jgi:hypothetical protein
MTDAGLRLGAVSFADTVAESAELRAAHAADDGARGA